MNYIEIKDVALSYADRQDTETIGKVDSFLRIVEARLNRYLNIGEAHTTIDIALTTNEFENLPSDFSEIRNIFLKDKLTDTTGTNLCRLPPESMNLLKSASSPSYVIIAGQLHIFPNQNGKYLQLTYSRKLPQLDNINTSNWLSIEYPDSYVFGLLVEINSFVKDAEAATLWEERFQQSILDIDHKDLRSRWSGHSLTIRSE